MTRAAAVFLSLVLSGAALGAPAAKAKPSIAPAKRAEPTQKVLVALRPYDELTATRLQIFLDNNDFGPGKIDGQMGEFFRKALVYYKCSHRMRGTGVVDQWLLDQVPEPFTAFTIPPETLNFVGPMASKPSEQAKLPALKYGSLREFVAERFHSAEGYLRKLNPGMNLDLLQLGDTVKVPNVQSVRPGELHSAVFSVPADPILDESDVREGDPQQVALSSSVARQPLTLR